jgi:hypothetical protein
MLCQGCYCCQKATTVPRLLMLCQGCYCCQKAADAVPRLMLLLLLLSNGC